MNQWLKKLDWKFLLMLIASLAALYPAWLPYIQSPEKAIQIQLISQTALQPNITNNDDLGLELTVDKIAVKDPYLTVFKIINSGRQPILSKDFESPLEIIIDQDKSVLRAQISDKTPKDLKPTIQTNKNIMSLNPILLNPHDVITLSILSTNGKPSFNTSARIAGIEKIDITTQDQKDQNSFAIPFIVIWTFVLMTLSTASMWRFETTDSKLITFNRRTIFFFNIALFSTAVICLQVALHISHYWSYVNLIISFLILIVITMPIAIWLEKRSKPVEVSESE